MKENHQAKQVTISPFPLQHFHINDFTTFSYFHFNSDFDHFSTLITSATLITTTHTLLLRVAARNPIPPNNHNSQTTQQQQQKFTKNNNNNSQRISIAINTISIIFNNSYAFYVTTIIANTSHICYYHSCSNCIIYDFLPSFVSQLLPHNTFSITHLVYCQLRTPLYRET